MMGDNDFPYLFLAQPVHVVDGDTLDLHLDLGFRQYTLTRFRLLGVDTPELHSADPSERARAIEAKNFSLTWCGLGNPARAIQPSPRGPWLFTASTQKSDAFGRWLVELKNPAGESLSSALIFAGLAAPWKRGA